VGMTDGGTMIALRAARVALSDGDVEGWVSIADGMIAGISADDPPAGVERLDLGDLDLIPALVDLHCDCIEGHAHPRPTVELPLETAIVSLDTELAAHGFGTAFVCVVLDEEPGRHRSADRACEVVECIQAMHSELRVDLRVHLRVETCSPAAAVAGSLARVPVVGMLSYMEHLPGRGQYVDEAAWRQAYDGRGDGAATALLASKTRHAGASGEVREMLSGLSRELGSCLASHDDDSPEAVEEAVRLGVGVSEFPVTLEAAEAARGQGLGVVLGAPNARAGRSHVGNLSTREAMGAGALDALASDYHPPSLLAGAYALADGGECSWAEAIALVTQGPARLVGLEDRGAIVPGARADLAAIERVAGQPVLKQLWRGSRPVFGTLGESS
jgi:alpha-D-ribose 1-methylphosphonate 5-triphosphate diphosphatase